MVLYVCKILGHIIIFCNFVLEFSYYENQYILFGRQVYLAVESHI